jgi:hypothetical protein
LTGSIYHGILAIPQKEVHMSQTTVWVTSALAEEVKRKANLRVGIHPGFVVSLALDLWARDEWEPGEDIEGLKDERLFLQLEPSSYQAALEKRRRVPDSHISLVYRKALDLWARGEWEIGLVRNDGS